MRKIKLFADGKPLAFALVVTFIFILMVFISSIAASGIWPGDTPGWFLGGTIGRLVSISILLLVLSRLGWLDLAGFTRAGMWSAWLALFLPLAYAITMSAYAMTGNLDFSISDPALAGFAAIFLMAHALLEEIAFRGLIMQGFIRSWGGTNRGLLWSVILSSFFFGVMHIIYLAGEPLLVVLLRIVFAFLIGIYFGTLVLSAKSIYPAAFFHGALNLAGYLNLSSSGIEGTPSAWLLMSLLIVPLVVYGLYQFRGTAHKLVLPEAV